MPRLELNDREQWALRDLLGDEPSPGSPLPTREVLEHLAVLIPADEVGAVAFVTPDELVKRHAEDPFSAWFMTVLDAARPAIRELTGPASGW